MLSFALVFLASVADAEELPLATRTREMMATQVTVSISGVSVQAAERGFAAAFKEFERVEEVMNEWRQDSPLSAINAAAGNGRFVSAPADLCKVLRKSLQAAEKTNGLFDPTWAALRELWRFGTDVTGDVPSRAAVEKACPLVSYRNVELRSDHLNEPSSLFVPGRMKSAGSSPESVRKAGAG